MSATRAGRNLTRSLLLVLGGSAVVAGAILTSFGLYREFVSSGDASAPSLASQHRTDPGVVYDLKDVQAGDSIILRGDSGTEIWYTVSDSFTVDPNDPNALSVMAPTPADVITLITCDGSFFYTGDPVFNGDYTQRRIVRAAFSRLTQAAAAVGG